MGEIKHERVREKVKFECARVIQQKLNDPRAGFITVQSVELSHDFRNAKVFVSVLGSDADKRKVMRMLEQARGYIQREVAGTLRTRVTPQLKFVLDTSVDKSFKVAEILEQIKKENPGKLEQSDGLGSDAELEPSASESDGDEDDEGDEDEEDEDDDEGDWDEEDSSEGDDDDDD